MPHKCINPLSHLLISSLSSDPVSKPVINIMKIKKVNNSCYLNLSCVAWGQSLNYTWYWDSGLSPKELQSSELVITVNPENYSKFYTCQVSNPVSNKNHTVYFTSACELGKKYFQGCRWGHRVTSFLLNKERYGDPIQPLGTELGGKSQRYVGDSCSTPSSPPSELNSPLWSSVS